MDSNLKKWYFYCYNPNETDLSKIVWKATKTMGGLTENGKTKPGFSKAVY
jgi:hypothetical protein